MVFDSGYCLHDVHLSYVGGGSCLVAGSSNVIGCSWHIATETCIVPVQNVLVLVGSPRFQITVVRFVFCRRSCNIVAIEVHFSNSGLRRVSCLMRNLVVL